MVSTAPAHGFSQPAITAKGLRLEPLVVLDAIGDDVELAGVHDGVAVRRWAPLEALGLAVTREIAVAPAARAAPDPATRLLSGFRLDGEGDWRVVHATGALELDGFVHGPELRRVWDDPEPTATRPIQLRLAIHAAPDPTSPTRAIVTAGSQVDIRVRSHAHDRWMQISVRGSRVAVDGFVELPPPVPASEPAEIESDWAPPEPHGWLPIGACLRSAPGGEIIGAVVGDVTTKPGPAIAGWTSIVVPTAWGDVTVYSDAPLVDPPREPAWDFNDTWGHW